MQQRQSLLPISGGTPRLGCNLLAQPFIQHFSNDCFAASLEPSGKTRQKAPLRRQELPPNAGKASCSTTFSLQNASWHVSRYISLAGSEAGSTQSYRAVRAQRHGGGHPNSEPFTGDAP